MKFSARALLVCALLVGCDEEGSAGQETSEPDAGPTELRVTNVGTSCSLLNRSCTGSDAQCLEISYSGAFYPGGYCTADCEQSEQCGPSGVCPVGEAERIAGDYKFRSTWARKCFKTCSPGVSGSCRAGYACRSLAEVYEADDAPAPMHSPVCVPSWSTLTRDAGAPT
ncbi:MAG TPA: hypothetical protein VFX59_11965, partial [Polyangiales bacterium]|nr:hypothetical protein [Polyangiales bacterium]